MVLSSKHSSSPCLTSSVRPRMSVNVALCGGIPRSHFKGLCNSERCGNELPTHTSPTMALKRNINNMRTILGERQPLTRLHEAPAWAVPAKGETRLEPVCEGLGRQVSVDLTTKSVFCIGRSPTSDVQLMHVTSSRRHAMLFHHTNGSCYIVDCGSAHGTYVNGVRLASPGNAGVVVPHKVRRGALIRFGGPGAPCFILKSFSFWLRDLTKDEPESDSTDLLRRNTRLNALGSTAVRSVCEALNLQTDGVSRKRSFDSLSTSDTLDEEFEPSLKRSRCASPSLSPEQPLRLVSPDLDSILVSKRRRTVRFSTDPPDECYPVLP